MDLKGRDLSDSRDPDISDFRDPMIIFVIPGTRFSILGTRIGSSKRLKKNMIIFASQLSLWIHYGKRDGVYFTILL